MANANIVGISLSKISPRFLHSNATSHTSPFSAVAELIDNAYDPDVNAKAIYIDTRCINNILCLVFCDNGCGMDPDRLMKMLSFGYCDKDAYESGLNHLPIGHYGNGFKSGSMRLARDVVVFTVCPGSASVGFLSQSYHDSINADRVFIPMVTYHLPQRDGKLELDFESDRQDIRNPEAHEVDLTSVYHRTGALQSSGHVRSLRAFCSILFLKPRMQIYIRKVKVKTKLISKSLSNTEIDIYKPTWLSTPLRIIFGFSTMKPVKEDFGVMFYHRNRLIKAYEKLGCQRQPNNLGMGVVGVVKVDFLKPIHNKQDFEKDEKYNATVAAIGVKLTEYWREKQQDGPSPPQRPLCNSKPDWLWAQCDKCLKWRRLLDNVDTALLSDKWYCHMNADPTHNRCDIEEEPENEDEAVLRPTYQKTFKRKLDVQKRNMQDLLRLSSKFCTNFGDQCRRLNGHKRRSMSGAVATKGGETVMTLTTDHGGTVTMERTMDSHVNEDGESRDEGADHNTQLSVRGFGGPTLLPAHDARRRSRQCSTGWSVNAAPTPRKSLETSAVIDLTVDDDDDSRDVKAVNCYPQQSRVTGQSAVNGGVSNPVERCYGNASSEVNLVKEEPVERCYGNASSEVNLVKEEPVETEHELAEMKRRHKLLLQGHRQLQDNIHRLLSIIFPDVDIGPVDDIKAVIVDMIQTNSSVPQ